MIDTPEVSLCRETNNMYATKRIICIYKDAYINPALHDFIEMS